MSTLAEQTHDQPQVEHVGLLWAGGRERLMVEPLEAVGVDVTVNPPYPAALDVAVIDRPGGTILREAKRSCPIVYRLRGNYWREQAERRGGSVRSWLSKQFVWPRLDAILALDSRQEQLATRRTGVRSGSVPLPIDTDEWATNTHRGQSLTLLTLTNMDYRAKIEPLLEWIPVVAAWCTHHDSEWLVCGDGSHADAVARACERHSGVSYQGFVDPKPHLGDADVLLHPSQFDIRAPNAILEGMAAGLPVVVSEFEGFRGHSRYIGAGTGSLRSTLGQLQDPATRAEVGAGNRAYVEAVHDPERIGRALRRFLAGVADA